MNSDKGRPQQKKSIPLLGFVWHRIKLLLKSKVVKKLRKSSETDKKKAELEKNKGLDLNIFPRICLSEPLNIIGHILMWYRIPTILGIIFSLIAGYSNQSFVNWIDRQNLNLMFDMIFLMLGFLSIFPIVAFVALLRSLDSKYDIVGDGKYILNSDEMIAVAEQLAWNESEPEIEDAKWIADLLSKLWSNINIFLIRLVASFCPNCLLEPIIGPINQIAELEVGKLYLGDRVPSLTGIHVITRGVRREDMIIDCEFTYDADFNIEIIGKYHINFGIKWFYFKGKIRIILTPLFRDLPVIGNLQLSLLEMPTINWEFTGLLSVLNWNLLKNLVQCIITYFFQIPHSFAINIAKIIAIREMKLSEPIGLLRIEIMSVKSLPSVESFIPSCTGKPDPYCKVEVEEQQMWTHVIANDFNPEWNREFCFLVHNSITNSIIITVWDEDLVEDQLIGDFSIPIKSFVDNKTINGQEITVPLSIKKKNSLVKSKPKPPPNISFRVSWFKLSTDVKQLDSSASHARAQLPVASLSVLVDSATGLDTCTAQVRSPELRPLVRISVGNQIRVTSIKRRTGNPVWEESHHFILYNPKLETIHIEVIDMYFVEERQLIPYLPINIGHLGKFADHIGLANKGTVLGHYDVPTADILKSHKMKMEGTYRLEGYVENGHIRLLMAVRITEFEPNVAENVRKSRTLLSDIRIREKHIIMNQMKEKQLNKSKEQQIEDQTNQKSVSEEKDIKNNSNENKDLSKK